jgi:hypothetical protein
MNSLKKRSMDPLDEYLRSAIQKSLARCHPPVSARKRLLHAAAHPKQGSQQNLFTLLLDALIKGQPFELPEGFELSAYYENRLFLPRFGFFLLRPV